MGCTIAGHQRIANGWLVGCGLALAPASAVVVAHNRWRMTGVFVVGLTLGLALYQASFGFRGGRRHRRVTVIDGG